MEYIPGSISLPFGSLNEEEISILTQLRTFIDLAVRENILLDIKPNNFGLKNGVLTLFDFQERSFPETKIFNDEMRSSLVQAIKQWACGNETVRLFLLENVQRMDSPLARDLMEHTTGFPAPPGYLKSFSSLD